MNMGGFVVAPIVRNKNLQRVSAKRTRIYTKILPKVWLIAFGIGSVLNLFIHFWNFTGNDPFWMRIIPIIFWIGFYSTDNKYLAPMMDEVFIGDGVLLFIRGNKEVRLKFSEIKSIKYSLIMTPIRVIVTSKKTTAFGDKIIFEPKGMFKLNLPPEFLRMVNGLTAE